MVSCCKKIYKSQNKTGHYEAPAAHVRGKVAMRLSKGIKLHEIAPLFAGFVSY